MVEVSDAEAFTGFCFNFQVDMSTLPLFFSHLVDNAADEADLFLWEREKQREEGKNADWEE